MNNIKIATLLTEAAELLTNDIDNYVELYIKKNKSKLESGNIADKAFEDVESSLNVDNAFIYEKKTFDGIPAMYMRSSKSNTLVLIYFAIKDEAKHIEFKPSELEVMFK